MSDRDFVPPTTEARRSALERFVRGSEPSSQTPASGQRTKPARKRKLTRRTKGWIAVAIGAFYVWVGWASLQQVSLLNDQGRPAIAEIVEKPHRDGGSGSLNTDVVYTADDGSVHRANVAANSSDYLGKKVSIWYIPGDWRVGRGDGDGTFSGGYHIFEIVGGMFTVVVGLVLIYMDHSKRTWNNGNRSTPE